VCAASWWWWFTAPPHAALTDLAALAAEAQADADGILIVGDPARAGRWLARHPQAMLPLAFAAPETVPASERIAPAARVLAGRSRSGLILWWRDGDIALAARVDERIVASLVPLAASGALNLTHEETHAAGQRLVILATGPGLLDARGGPAPAVGTGKGAALCRIGDRWWRVTATRSVLQCASGEPPRCADLGERSEATFSDLRRNLPAVAAFGAGRPLSLILAADPHGWALALPGLTLPSHMTRLLSAGGDTAATGASGPRRWEGALGEVWVDSRHGLALGSSPERVGEVAGRPISDAGAIRAGEVSRLVESAASRLDRVPGLAREVSALRAFSRSLSGLRSARWHVGAEGGHVRLEW
jgi:hypothetical protein